MMRLITLIFCFLLTFGWVQPVMAQTQPTQVSQEELQRLNDITNQAFAATNKGDFATAEGYWTQILDQYPNNAAVWSNRGNSRVSQNKLDAALADYNKAVELAPDVTDPYLNRGAALEGLGRWEDAIADYNRVLEMDPKDAMAYNNRGNAEAGLRQWDKAIEDFKKSADTAPNFAFARANYALALYEIGDQDEAIHQMRNILRKYPKFADVRASITAALWAKGDQGEAESNWVAAVGLDPRYKNIDWVRDTRRWAPSMVAALDKFLKLQ
jgi:tetratricopeptide (TPR) repeat protein